MMLIPPAPHVIIKFINLNGGVRMLPILSLILSALVFFAIYGLYTSNMGALGREYLSQLLTVAIVAFLLWRAETLQEL